MHDEWMNIRQIEDKYKCAKVSIDIPKALDEYFQIDPTKTYYEFPSDFSEDLKEAMYTPTRHWEVNKKKYNFMERARYRYTNETKKKLSSVTKTSAFSKSAGETSTDTTQSVLSKEKNTTKKKKKKKKKPNKVEIEISNAINPYVVFVTDHRRN